MRIRLGWIVLASPLFIPGCLLDIAPGRESIDATWQARMLAGEYGQSSNGEKSPYVGPDTIASSLLGVSGTRYKIDIGEQSTLGGGGWSMVGGLVGRVARPDASVELFGKEIARVHGVMQTTGDQDKSAEFFLVIRPKSAGLGRLVKRWGFPSEELGRTVPPALEKNLRARYTGIELEKALERSKGIHLNGYLSFDEPSKIATVTITGLARPFEERVDLSQELR